MLATLECATVVYDRLYDSLRDEIWRNGPQINSDEATRWDH